ncbi:MAG: TraX family protein [Trueperaceae bacterium]
MKTIQHHPSPRYSLFAEVAWLRPTLSTGQQEALKWLAIFTMTLDHLDKVLLFGTDPILMGFGRLAFPLFAFLIAYNLGVRGVKPTRYLWPLILFAVATQPVYMWLWPAQAQTGNIMFTLCFGVLYVGLYELFHKRLPALVSHALLVLILLIPAVQVSYGPAGVFFIPLLVAFLKRPSILFFVGVLVALLAVNNFALYAMWGLLTIPAIYWVTRMMITLERTNAWFFYLYYPAHLFLLKLLANRLF